MAERVTGSFAREIDPDGGIKGPDLSRAFERANDNRPPLEQPSQQPSAQIANHAQTPREPAPSFGYDQAKAAEHRQGMQVDHMAVKKAALKAKAQLFAKQDAARKGREGPSMGKAAGRDRGMERGDD